MNASAEYGEGCEYVSLLRKVNAQPWGFRMMGGQDQGCSLYIAKVNPRRVAERFGLREWDAVMGKLSCITFVVNPRSVAERYGLREGDAVVRIGQVPATHLSHDHAKAEILRAGNDLHLMVKRNAVHVPSQQPAPKGRSEVVEEETQYMGKKGSVVQSRSFRIITDSLVEEMGEMPGDQSGSSTSNATAFG